VGQVSPHLRQSIEGRTKIVDIACRSALATGEILDDILEVGIERDASRLRLLTERSFNFRPELQSYGHGPLPLRLSHAARALNRPYVRRAIDRFRRKIASNPAPASQNAAGSGVGV